MMKRRIRQKIGFAIQIGILSFCFSTLHVPGSWGQSIAPEVASYINQLSNPDLDVRYKTTDALEKLGHQAQPAIPYLIEGCNLRRETS